MSPLSSTLPAQLRSNDWIKQKLIPFTSTINVGLALGVGRELHGLPLLAESSLPLVLLFLFVTLAGLGYYLNNLADAPEDRLADKLNPSARMSFAQRGLLLATLLLSSLGAMALLQAMRRTGYAWALYASHLASSAAYSLRPVRLKARGFAGVLAAVFAQYVSATLFALLYYRFPLISALPLVGCSFLSGLCLEVGHQRWDRERDVMAGIPTFAARAGKERVDVLYRRLLAADRICVWVTTIAYSLALILRGADPLAAVVFLFPILFLLRTTANHRRHAQAASSFADPYYDSKGDIVDTYHTYYPNFFLPLNLCCWLAVLRPGLIPFELLVVLVVFMGHEWRPIGWHFGIWRWVLLRRSH